jgi:hypothetical protein
MASTPEPPGPPGLRKIEPIRRAGVAGGQPDQRQRDLRPVRVVVVQRHPGGGALEALAAVGPVERRDGGRPTPRAIATDAIPWYLLAGKTQNSP